MFILTKRWRIFAYHHINKTINKKYNLEEFYHEIQ